MTAAPTRSRALKVEENFEVKETERTVARESIAWALLERTQPPVIRRPRTPRGHEAFELLLAASVELKVPR